MACANNCYDKYPSGDKEGFSRQGGFPCPGCQWDYCIVCITSVGFKCLNDDCPSNFKTRECHSCRSNCSTALPICKDCARKGLLGQAYDYVEINGLPNPEDWHFNQPLDEFYINSADDETLNENNDGDIAFAPPVLIDAHTIYHEIEGIIPEDRISYLELLNKIAPIKLFSV